MSSEYNDMAEADTDAGIIRLPEDAFAALGNSLRIDILYTLWEAHDPPGPTPLSFSQLQERIAASDSGNFNYHLNTLVGTFVERTDDGYVLRNAGQMVIRSVLAGTNTEDPKVDPVAIDEVCIMCEGTLMVSYYDGETQLWCPDCANLFPGGEYPSETNSVWPLPPAGVRHRTPEEMLNAAFIRHLANVWLMIEGICPACSAAPALSIHDCEGHDLAKDGFCLECGNPTPTSVDYTCRNCKYHIRTGPWTHVLFHPTVTAFLYDHDIEAKITSRKYWERAFECGEEVVSSDPLRIEVTVPAGDDVLCVTLDEEMIVVGITESPSY